MEPIRNFQLALRIGGTKQRRAGFAPLVAVGVLSGNEGDNMYRSTLITENPAYIIKHTQDYVLYQMLDLNVKPFDAEPSGALCIALTVPSGAQLANGKSPYTLLQEVYQTFTEKYMVTTNDGRKSFTDNDYDVELFREIARRYSLESRRGGYITMSPQGATGKVCVAPAHLEEFFRDSQYPEFRPFKEIEVGTMSQPSTELANIQIPRPISYEVWINNRSVNRKLTRLSDKYISSVPGTKYEEYPQVSFTLQDLLNAPGQMLQQGEASITLDAANSRIMCQLPPQTIYYSLVITSRNDLPFNLFKEKKIKLFIGNIDLSDAVGSPNTVLSYKASEVLGQNASLRPSTLSGYQMAVHTRANEERRIIEIELSIKAAPAPTTSGVKPIGTSPSPTGRRVGSQPGRPNGTPMTAVPPTGGSNTTQDPFSMPPQKKKGYRLLIAFAIGLLIGIGIGWLIGHAGTTEVTPVSNDTITVETVTPNNTPNSADSTATQLTVDEDSQRKEEEETARLKEEEAKKKADEEARKAKEEAEKRAQAAAATRQARAQAREEVFNRFKNPSAGIMGDVPGWKDYITPEEQQILEKIRRSSDLRNRAISGEFRNLDQLINEGRQYLDD